MGCGASKNSVAAPEPVTIEARPKLEPEPPQTSADEVKVPSSSEPAAAADSVPPSPTPSQKSTSSRISVRSKQNSNRPGSGKRKSSLRQKFEKLRHDGAEVTDSSEKEADESDRGLSAISKDSGYTADSEVGPIGDGPPSAVLEEESANPQVEAARACPSTPDLTLQGVAICSTKTSSATRRHPGSLPPLTPKSLKGAAKSSSTPVLPTDTPGIEDKLGPPTPSSGRSVSFADKVEVISPQIIERTSSRGGLAFDLQFTPDPGNIKRTPSRMMKLDSKRKCKSADVLRRELEERMQAAEARKKVCMLWLHIYKESNVAMCMYVLYYACMYYTMHVCTILYYACMYYTVHVCTILFHDRVSTHPMLLCLYIRTYNVNQ